MSCKFGLRAVPETHVLGPAAIGDPDNVEITDEMMAAMAGVSMSGARTALEPPRMVTTLWREGQTFSTEDDPDRMRCTFKGKTG